MLEEKVVRRGEVWWVTAEGSSDWEMNFGRPAVVISGNAGNEKSEWVMVAMVSSQKRGASAIHPRVMFPEGERRVLCNQVYTVKQSRLDRKICTLTEPEMIRVGGALAVAQCIPQGNQRVNATKSENKDEKDDLIASLRCEADMWRRMYDKVMDQLADVKVRAALAVRTDVAEEPTVAVESDIERKLNTPKPVTAQELVDINHCSDTALRELGLSRADCDSIIACRPFDSVLELNCVPDLDTKWVAANEHRFVCTPIKEEPKQESESEVVRVNLNTCAAKDLMAVGIAKGTAYKITSDRKQHGRFATVNDVARVKGVSMKWVALWVDKLEV